MSVTLLSTLDIFLSVFLVFFWLRALTWLIGGDNVRSVGSFIFSLFCTFIVLSFLIQDFLHVAYYPVVLEKISEHVELSTPKTPPVGGNDILWNLDDNISRYR